MGSSMMIMMMISLHMMTMMMISPHMSVSCLVFMEMIYSEDYTANTATDSATDDLKDFKMTMRMMIRQCHAMLLRVYEKENLSNHSLLRPLTPPTPNLGYW